MNDTPIHSPDQSMRAESGSHQQILRIEWPPLPGWVTPALIVCCALLIGSLISNAVLWNRYNDLRNTVEVKTRLNAFNLRNLETSKISWLIGQVQTNHALIEAYGIGKSCRRSK